MRNLLVIFVFPPLLFAQPFALEIDSIPVQQYGWNLNQPWTGGDTFLSPCFVDIDYDGDYDLFAGESYGRIYFYRNDGDHNIPNFQYMTDFYDSISAYSWSVPNFCDIDSDGDQDLFLSGAFPTSFGTSILYYDNVGDMFNCNFQLIDSCFSGAYFPYGTIFFDFCDIDADGDYDLFLSNNDTPYRGKIYFYRNTGTPQNADFQLESQCFDSINVVGEAHPRFVDIDNDGDYDLFIGIGDVYLGPDSAEGRILYYENVGTPQQYNFQLISSFYDSIDVGKNTSPFFVDIDGDNDLDLFVGRDGVEPGYFYTGTIGGDLYYYENIGNSSTPNFEYITKNYLTIDIGGTAKAKLYDIDGDGDLDLFLCYNQSIVYYKNTGTATLPEFTLISEQYPNIVCDWGIDMDLGDLDADGDYDLIVSSGTFGEHNIDLFLNIGTPDTAIFQLYQNDFVSDFFNPVPRLVDIDADNDLDLLIGQYVGTIWFYENIGDSAQPRYQLVTSNYMNIDMVYGTSLDFVDYDTDSDYDMFISQWNRHIYYYENIGLPNSADFVLADTSFQDLFYYNNNYPEFNDIDADGDLDLFVGESGGVWFYRNQFINSVTQNYSPQPYSFSLNPCYPNPFNPTATISFTLNKTLPMKLMIYDISGRIVGTQNFASPIPGQHQFLWNAEGLASGLYFITLEGERVRHTQKVILLK